MRRIGWGRRLRAALRAQGCTHAGRAEILDGLRYAAAGMGRQAAEITWAEVKDRPDVPLSAREDVALDISAEINGVLSSIMVEWGIPRSTETERAAEVAETAFRERWGDLTGQTRGAA